MNALSGEVVTWTTGPASWAIYGTVEHVVTPRTGPTLARVQWDTGETEYVPLAALSTVHGRSLK